jgi:hypothetical protein
VRWEVYLNAPGPALEEYPASRERPIGGTLTLFIRVTGVRAAYDALESRLNVVMPLEKKWYGVTEFACTDPDGYVSLRRGGGVGALSHPADRHLAGARGGRISR